MLRKFLPDFVYCSFDLRGALQRYYVSTDQGFHPLHVCQVCSEYCLDMHRGTVLVLHSFIVYTVMTRAWGFQALSGLRRIKDKAGLFKRVSEASSALWGEGFPFQALGLGFRPSLLFACGAYCLVSCLRCLVASSTDNEAASDEALKRGIRGGCSLPRSSSSCSSAGEVLVSRATFWFISLNLGEIGPML